MPSGADTTPVACVETNERSALRIAALLTETFAAQSLAVSAEDAGSRRFRVTAHFRATPDEEAIRALVAAADGHETAAALRFGRVPAKDWVTESLAGLGPVVAGRFIIHGSHDRARIAVNGIAIEIEAALAFGTGHHSTTRGCLLALDRIAKVRIKPCRPRTARPCKGEDRGGGRRAQRLVYSTPTRLAYARQPPPSRGRNLKVFDLGTGSGILAIAAARAWRRRVLAADVDPTAVRAARANALLNRVGGSVEIVRAGGVAAPSVRQGAPFDVVFANILLGSLIRLAAPLKKLTAPGGRIILSGLLPEQANAAIAAYRPLALEHRINLDGWTTLVLARHVRRRRAVAAHRVSF